MTSICFSAHPDIHNKPAEWEPRFGVNWYAVAGTLEDLRDRVAQGDAFIAAAMTSGKRTSAAFESSSLAVVDVDYGLTSDQLRAHPLTAHACLVYTTPSHNPEAGLHRFRVLFNLPERITDPDLYKAIVTILTRALGGDESCKDPCRIWYGNSAGEQLIWNPEMILPGELITDAHTLAEKSKVLYDPDAPEADANSIARAIFVLEQVIEPLSDGGNRDKYLRISAAAKSGGSEVFPAWSDWASRCHHGSGSKKHQSSERWWNGLTGTSLGTLFFFASEDDPHWRDKLPEELRVSDGYTPGRTSTYAGYAMEDFMGDPEEAPTKEAIYGLFDPNQPWAKTVKPEAPPAGHADADFEGDPDSVRDPSTTPKRGPGRPKKSDPIDVVMGRLRNLYPGLRLNLVTQRLEFGPKDNPQEIHDPSTTYLRVSRGTGELFPKTMVADLMHLVGFEQRSNPVINYLESALAREQPCPYFDRIGSELLGLSEDDTENPTLPNGQRLGDVVIKRFLIGAVARVLDPGCTMDWMPILIGPQNLGKTTFFNYLAPELPNGGGNDWVTTLQQGITQIKEKPHILHSGWLVILDEVERYFQRRYVEELKNLVSVRSDYSAKKYQNEQRFPRNFVLAGATNNRDIFQDPTGNRRFLPIVVVGKIPARENRRLLTIDLDRLRQDRDSIWAAAYQAYLEGESHLFTSYELEMIAGYLSGFTADSPIEAQVLKELTISCAGHHNGRRYTTLSEICRALKVPIESQNNLQRPITDALKRAGWEMKQIRIYEKLTRVWLSP